MMHSDIEKLRECQRIGDLKSFDRLVEERGLSRSANPQIRLLRAVVAGLRQDPETMEQAAAGLDDTAFESSPDLADYALLRLIRGDTDGAELLLRECTVAADADAYAFARLGTIQVMKNELEAAAQNLEQALVRRPDQPEFLTNLGAVRLRQDRLEDALACYERALAMRPDFPVAQQQRNRVRIALGQTEEILAEREEYLEAHPDEPDAFVRLAQVQSHLDRQAEAESTLQRALETFPEDRSVRHAFVQQLFQARKWWKAGKQLYAWHQDDPNDLGVRTMLNRARLESRFLDAVEADLAEWSEEERRSPSYPLVYARLLSERQRASEAVAVLEEALERFPGLTEARAQLGQLLNQLGRLDEAREHQHKLASIAPGAAIEAIASGGLDATDDDIAFLRQVKDTNVVGREQRSQAGFTLGRVLDQQGDHDGAFEALKDANELERQALSYDWRQHRRQTQARIKVFGPQLRDRLADAGHPSRRPIFVLGMPRSGTTLTEQILASHPKVYGAGELGVVSRVTRLTGRVVGARVPYPFTVPRMTKGQVRDAGRYYLDRIAEIEDQSDHVVDKLPHNFDHIGLIALMLPNAKIVHLQRDPRDVAVSNYFQNFGAKQGLMGFAFDLANIGHMLNDHDRIMAHWHELFPGRIYELSYEALVRDPETAIAKLLEACGLPWDDRVMRFYETQRPVKTASVRQVREGIYTSSAEKWRRYERHLGPLEEVLAEGYRDLTDEELADLKQGNVQGGRTGTGTTARIGLTATTDALIGGGAGRG